MGNSSGVPVSLQLRNLIQDVDGRPRIPPNKNKSHDIREDPTMQPGDRV